jgi:hypothetical protein
MPCYEKKKKTEEFMFRITNFISQAFIQIQDVRLRYWNSSTLLPSRLSSYQYSRCILRATQLTPSKDCELAKLSSLFLLSGKYKHYLPSVVV